VRPTQQTTKEALVPRQMLRPARQMANERRIRSVYRPMLVVWRVRRRTGLADIG
jgi:hypothetical protein